MSQPPPSHQPQHGASPGGGFGPQTPPPAPNTPPSAPPLPPAGQPGQPGYGYPQQTPPPSPQPVRKAPEPPSQPAQQPAPHPAAPQGPYGYPQQPGPGPQPAPPGPQQPHAQGQPPYGYPQPPPPGGQGFGAAAPPGPYGPSHTPPPGAMPPGWGPPPGPGGLGGAPMPGMAGLPGTPPPGQGKANGSRIALIVAAVLVLLLAAGGGAVLVFSGDDEKKPSADPTTGDGDGGGGNSGEGDLPAEPVAAALAWQTAGPDVSAEDIILGARGSWISGDTLVRTLDDAVAGYDLETGEEAWRIPLELSGGDCNASPTASADRIAVLQGRDCEVLTVIDIAAGEEINTIPLELDAGYLTDTTYPAFLGDTIALGWGTGGAGYDAASGEQLWTTSSEEDCPEVAYAVFDDLFVSQTSCGFVGDEGGSIRATDEAGDELWEWEYGPEYQGRELRVHSVVSIDPLVVTAWLDDDIEQESIFVIDENHQEISHALDYDIDHYKSPCMINTLNDCKMSVVHDGFLYLASSTSGEENAVVAFELSSGQPLYEVGPDDSDGGPSSDAFREIRPFAVEDGRILAYQRDTWDDSRPGMVVAIDPATEEATPLMTLDPAASAVESAAGSPTDPQELRLIWHDNTLLMLTEAFYEGDLEEREATLVYR
ncbi:PQQ-binding-like beta-propeller repeat protein [Streptomyces sp. B6B3]|uniref:outer membrane protein assembly factor BamB family protein n=1 Tax=Streptomyces sp. B6B3 TaxID=3153570 RepID=UPI00325D5718